MQDAPCHKDWSDASYELQGREPIRAARALAYGLSEGAPAGPSAPVPAECSRAGSDKGLAVAAKYRRNPAPRRETPGTHASSSAYRYANLNTECQIHTGRASALASYPHGWAIPSLWRFVARAPRSCFPAEKPRFWRDWAQRWWEGASRRLAASRCSLIWFSGLQIVRVGLLMVAWPVPLLERAVFVLIGVVFGARDGMI